MLYQGNNINKDSTTSNLYHLIKRIGPKSTVYTLQSTYTVKYWRIDNVTRYIHRITYVRAFNVS